MLTTNRLEVNELKNYYSRVEILTFDSILLLIFFLDLATVLVKDTGP